MSALERIPRQQILSTVAANTPLCREHFRLDLLVPSFPPTDPGHFVQLSCRDPFDEPDAIEMDWEPGLRPILHDPDLISQQAVLRRPFSLAGRADTPDGVRLEVIHRVVGIGTAWLAALSPGDRINVLGPLGNRFTLPPSNAPALLIGGGVGIPPMLYLAERLSGKPAVAFCGATTKDLLPFTLSPDASATPNSTVPSQNVHEFARHGIPTLLTTDDGSHGFRGYVTQALESYLDREFRPATSAITPGPILYTCGPELMMRRVADIAARRGLECQIAVERAMACGMGTCQSCVIKVKTSDSSAGWKYRLACTDGPVFRGSELMW